MSWVKIDQWTQLNVGSIISEKAPLEDSKAQTLLKIHWLKGKLMFVKEIYSSETDIVSEEIIFSISREELIDGNYNILNVGD